MQLPPIVRTTRDYKWPFDSDIPVVIVHGDTRQAGFFPSKSISNTHKYLFGNPVPLSDQGYLLPMHRARLQSMYKRPIDIPRDAHIGIPGVSHGCGDLCRYLSRT
jgi:hypothetical protein